MSQRSIFQEVSSAEPAPTATRQTRQGDRRGVALWFWILTALVALMVLVGGLTRLTDSGLSITEWNAIGGAIPPLSEAAWRVEFDKYRQIPEYQLQNKGMTLAEFKVIYWWEWGHRQLGRLVGLVWALGMAWFLIRRAIPKGWLGRMVLVGALGGLQGAVGWWMVSSGLTGRMLDVASYRLAIHLGLAFLILGLLMWFAMRVRMDEVQTLQARRRRAGPLRGIAALFSGLLFLQILLGALVAGIDAGTAYTDWPLMAGEVFPSEAFDLTPLWSNLFENAALVQFNHRILAYLVFGLGVLVFIRCRRSGLSGVKRWGGWVKGLLLCQVILGIVTLMTIAPLHWSSLHQITGLALWAATIRLMFEIAYPAQDRIARG